MTENQAETPLQTSKLIARAKPIRHPVSSTAVSSPQQMAIGSPLKPRMARRLQIGIDPIDKSAFDMGESSPSSVLDLGVFLVPSRRFSSPLPPSRLAPKRSLSCPTRKSLFTTHDASRTDETDNSRDRTNSSLVDEALSARADEAPLEMLELSRLRSESCEAFDEVVHNLLLRRLWSATFGTEKYSRISERWEELGFQSSDPVRDLRGSGALGLRQLVHFMESSGAVVNNALLGFPLAVASFNVSQMLCCHLQLLTSPAGGAGAVPHCSDMTLRNFLRLHCHIGCQLCPSDTRTLLIDLMHEQLVRRLFSSWGRSAHLCTPPSPMCFPGLLADLSKHMQGCLTGLRAPWSMHGALLALRDLHPDIPSASGPGVAVDQAYSSLPTVVRILSVAALLFGTCSRDAVEA